MWILKGAEHDDFPDLMMIAGGPEVLHRILDGRLREDGEDLPIEHRSHVAGVDIEVSHLVQLDAVVLVCVGEGLQAWMLLYLSLCFSVECATCW